MDRQQFLWSADRAELIARVKVPEGPKALLTAIFESGELQTRGQLAVRVGRNVDTVSRQAKILATAGLLVVEHSPRKPSRWMIQWDAIGDVQGLPQVAVIALAKRRDWSQVQRLRRRVVVAGQRTLRLPGLFASLLYQTVITFAGTTSDVISAPKRTSLVALPTTSDATLPVSKTSNVKERESRRVVSRRSVSPVASLSDSGDDDLEQQIKEVEAIQRRMGIVPEASDSDDASDDNGRQYRQHRTRKAPHPDTGSGSGLDKNKTNPVKEKTEQPKERLTKWTNRDIARHDLINAGFVAELWKEARAANLVGSDQLKPFVAFCRAVFRLSSPRQQDYPIKAPARYVVSTLARGTVGKTAMKWCSKCETHDYLDSSDTLAAVERILSGNVSVRVETAAEKKPSEPTKPFDLETMNPGLRDIAAKLAATFGKKDSK